MKSRNLALVLIPGAGMSDWIWEAVRDLFQVPVVTVADRLGTNTYAARKKATLADCVDHIRQVLDAAVYEEFVVVGHSGAGPIAALLAKALPDRVVHVIYVAANLPGHGHTMIDSLPFLVRLMNVVMVRRMIRKDSLPYKKLEKVIRERFCNDSPGAVVENVLSRQMRSEPLCAITETMDWSGFPPVPQTYLVLTKDQTLGVERQKVMASHLAIDDLVEVAADHMVMLSHPREFASAVNAIVERHLG